VVDFVEERLNKAREFVAIPVNFTKGDPVEQIFKLRPANDSPKGAFVPVKKN